MRNPSHIVVPVPPADRRNPRNLASRVIHPVETATRRARNALTAAANVVKSKDRAGRRRSQDEEWVEEAWAMYDQVGELRYSSNVQASAIGALLMEPSRTDANGDTVKLDDETELSATDRLALDVMSALGGDSPTGLEEIQKALALHLFMTGEGYLIGCPAIEYDETGKQLPFLPVDEYALTELSWKVYSSSEAREKNDKYVLGGVEYPAWALRVICVRRPHPLDSRLADCPVRSSMPVLRELVGLTMHISASIDSRLAGAGALFVPQSATALGITAPEDGDDEMDLVDALIEAGVTAIKNRDNASALVPVVVTVPDDCGFAPFHMTFATPLDSNAKELRDEAIRRLALGLDMPPEVLIGLGQSSHWNAWAIQEDNIRLHVIPTGALIADALTRTYMRPAMVQLGVAEDVALGYWLHPSADALTSRPNRLPEAVQLHAAGVLSDEALLDAGGYNAEDAAPKPAEVDEAVSTALDMLRAAPSLAQDPGLPALVAQLRQVLSGEDATTIDDPAADPSQVETEEVEQAEEQGPPNGGDAPDTPQE